MGRIGLQRKGKGINLDIGAIREQVRKTKHSTFLKVTKSLEEPEKVKKRIYSEEIKFSDDIF